MVANTKLVLVAKKYVVVATIDVVAVGNSTKVVEPLVIKKRIELVVVDTEAIPTPSLPLGPVAPVAPPNCPPLVKLEVLKLAPKPNRPFEK